MPELTMAYSDVSSDGLDSMLTLMIDEAEAKQEEVRQEIAEDVAELEARKQKQIENRDTAKDGASGYEAAIADAKAKLETAEEAMKSAINRYNSAIEGPLNQLNELAKAQDLKQIADYRNPIKSYRYSSFDDGKAPASCQSARNKFVVNMIESHNKCLYFGLPKGYANFDSKVTEILKSGVIEMEAATANLGKRGGWNSNGTGAYATLEGAKDAFKSAASKAESEFGNNRRRAFIIQDSEKRIARIQEDIDEKSSDAEFKKQIGWTSFYPSDAVREKINAYKDAMDQHFLSTYVVTMGDITKGDDKGNGVFEVKGGFNSVVTVTDALASKGGRKMVFRHIGMADLTDPKVKDADSVLIEIESGGMDRQPSDDSVERMQKEVIVLVTEFARDQASEKVQG
jgi:hypothetical protein